MTSNLDIPDGGLYGMTDAARLLGVSRSTLNRHINMHLIQCKIRKCNNRRVFTGRELKRYWGAQY